jgi:uncharacterized protein with ParB-like and HNH nuclease domain
MNIETVKTNFKKLMHELENSYLQVPDYQRDYVWKKGEQVEEFWQDIEEQFYDLKNKTPDSGSGLFLGNLILCNQHNQDKYQIVDGQQRMTTIFILLIAFRSFLKSMRSSTKKLESVNKAITRINDNLVSENVDTGEIEGHFFKAAPSINMVLEYISLEDWDGEFPSKINETPVKRQSNKVRPIYMYFFDQIKNLLDSNNDDFLVFNRVIQSLTFINVTLDDFRSAYLFFERTNSRGKNLEVADLLKAHLFANHESDIVEMWDGIAKNSNQNFTRMLKYFYISHKGHITASKLFNGLKTLYSNEESNKQFSAADLLINLDDFSKFFNAITKIESEEILKPVFLELAKTDKLAIDEDRLFRIYNSIDALNLFGVTQAIPLMWSLLKKFYSLELHKKPHDSLHKNTLVSFFEALENYHFINNYILDRVGNEVEKLYAEYAKRFHDVDNEIDFTGALNELYARLRSQIATKEVFVPAFSEIEYSKTKRNSIIYYILDRFNGVDDKYKKLKKDDKPIIFNPYTPYRKTDKTIEHWFPQVKAKDENDEVDSWCHSIGNLLALEKTTNSKLGHKTPQEKYLVLSNNKYINTYKENIRFLESHVAEYGSFDNWGEEAIKKRSLELADLAYTKIWHFLPPILDQSK